MIALARIRIDGGTQARAELNQSTVSEYAEAYRASEPMPPVVLFFDGSTYWLADGFHRYWGATDAGLVSIPEEVTPGSLRDAILYSLKANETHGLRRTNADKRKAVETLLKDAEWAKWSDRQIAESCAVSHPFVASIRNPEIAEKQQENRIKSVIKSAKVESDSTSVHANTETVAPVIESISNIAQVSLAPYDPQGDEVAELHETVRSLAEENDALKDRLAVSVIAGSEEEKTSALNTICALRKEVTRLEIENRALVASRDSYQRDNAEMKIQMASQRKQIAKLQAVAA